MANVKATTMGAIFAVCQSAAITKAGARPANRKAVAAPAICCIRNSSHHALGRGAVADLLTGTPIPRHQDRDAGSVVEHCVTAVDAGSPRQPCCPTIFRNVVPEGDERVDSTAHRSVPAECEEP